jgi:hypothetical protein
MHVRLALELARIYDVGAVRRLDEWDKTSIPILAHHLDRADMRGKLRERARAPHGTERDDKACAEAIDTVTQRLRRNPSRSRARAH